MAKTFDLNELKGNYAVVECDTKLYGYIAKELSDTLPIFVRDDMLEDKIADLKYIKYRYGEELYDVTITSIHAKLDMHERLAYLILGKNPRSFINYLDKKYDKADTEDNTIFEYDHYRNIYQQSEYNFFSTKLYGCDDFLQSIYKDINAIKTKKEFLKRIGGHSGFNYLLYGPPGVGKSSFVKEIAHNSKLPIFIVRMKVGKTDINNMLSPKSAYTSGGTYKVGDNPCIVLLEDFDRYLTEADTKAMSNLLNALDGVSDCYGTLRFFSVNNMDKIVGDEALMSRMGTTMHFEIPTTDTIKDYLSELFNNDLETVDAFVEQIKNKKITIRRLNSFLKKFALSDRPLSEALHNIEKLFEERENINKFVETKGE